MKLDLILRIGVKFLLPFILLFALYVQFHGELGPGGGFQAGVITAGMVILYAIIFGVDAAKRIAPQRMVEFMVPLGVLIYAGTGVAGSAAREELSRLFRTGARPAARPRTRDLPGRGRCADHGLRHDDRALLRVLRAGALMQHVQTFIGHYNYFITIFLMVAGLYIVIARGNMIKKLVGLALFQTSVYLLYIEPGKIIGGTAPILDPAFKVYSNPLPHVLILTAIVVGVATLALGLAIVARIHEAYGTIEEDEIFAREAQE